MPRRDGTGPLGTGRGGGLGRQSGIGAGRIGGAASADRDGYCECPKCGSQVKHNIAEPCSAVNCPQCGSAMIRA